MRRKNILKFAPSPVLAFLFSAFPIGARFVDPPAGDPAGGAGGGTGAGGASGGAGGGTGAGGASGGAGGAGGSGGAPDPAKAAELESAKAALKAANTNIADLTARINELAAKQPSAQDLQELETLRKERTAAEEKRKRDEGQFETLLAEANTKHAEELKKEREAREAAQTKYKRTRCRTELGNEIPKYTRVPVDQVIGALGMEAAVTFTDDEKFVIKDAAGVVYRNAEGKPATVAEYVQMEIDKNPWLKEHKPLGGSGGTNGNPAGGAANPDELTPEQIGKMSPKEFEKHRAALKATVGAR